MKKSIFLKISVILIFSVLLSSFYTSAYALDYNCPVKTESESVYLVNLDTGIPVYEKNADERRFPASTTKIMTYIVAFENISNIETTRVEIKQAILDELLGTGSSLSGLERHVGDKMTVKDLLYCLMVSSGNDAALVLADYVGKGDWTKFVDLMNNKAKELGCKDTNFMNPHGLDDDTDEHYSTAKDLYIITKYALTLPYFTEITNTTAYFCEGDENMWPLITTNYMIDQVRGGDFYYMYTRGIKTGTTDKAGRCIVTTAIADGYAYLCICLKAPYNDDEKNGAMTDSKELYRWAFLNLHLKPAVTAEQPICRVPVNFAWGVESVLLTPENDVNALMLKDEVVEKETDEEKALENVRYEVEVDESIDTPIKKGDILGTADIYYREQLLEKVNLVATENIDRSPVLYGFFIVQSILISVWFWLFLILALVAFFVYLLLLHRFKDKRQKAKKVKRYRNF